MYKRQIFFLPLLAIIVLLMSGTSVMRSAFLGCLVLVVCFLLKNSIHNPKFILSKEFWMFLFNGLVSGAKSAMTVAAACAAMGIVTQIFVMTGLAMNIVFFIKTLSGNVGILALVLTMAVTILFGMGVPTTAAYVLVASLAGSVLSELGFNSIAVHLFIYYFAALANITPPVASAALVASKIANSNYFKTAATATRLGLPGFILPFMFAYHQELLLMGDPLSIISIVFSCGVGLFCMCACFEGYILRELTMLERILMLSLIHILVRNKIIVSQPLSGRKCTLKMFTVLSWTFFQKAGTMNGTVPITSQGGLSMKAISRRLDRFCYNHPNFGIPNLMLYISVGTVVVYVANLLTNNAVISWLSFMPGMIFQHFQVWRIFTFVLVPLDQSPLWFILTTYLYYSLGTTLEQRWGCLLYTSSSTRSKST